MFKSTTPIYSYTKEILFRTRYIIICFFLSFLSTYYFKEELLYVVALPLQTRLIYTNVLEAFFTYIRLAIALGCFVSVPYVLYQTYMFLLPGLYLYEKKIFRIAYILSFFLYVTSISISYKILIPTAYQFFLGFQKIGEDKIFNIELQAKIQEYVSLSIQLYTILTICFQLPIFILILWRINSKIYDWIIKKRRFTYILIILFATILSPPDIISQIIIFLLLAFLFELSSFSIKLLNTYSTYYGDNRN